MKRELLAQVAASEEKVWENRAFVDVAQMEFPYVYQVQTAQGEVEVEVNKLEHSADHIFLGLGVSAGGWSAWSPTTSSAMIRRNPQNRDLP